MRNKNKKLDPVLETIDTYNKVAEDYKSRNEKYDNKNVMKVLLDYFLKQLKKSKKILDIGSGAGFDAKYLYEKGCEVTSIDLSENLLEIAKQIAPNVEFINTDARFMNFNNECFDGIWASASLLHIPKEEVRKVLTNIFSILKPHGIFFVAIKHGIGERFVVNKGSDNLNGARRFFAFYQKDEFEKLLNNSGFKVVYYEQNIFRGNIWMNFLCTKDIT